MKKLFLFIIRIYQFSHSSKGSMCRFYPSCSEYGYQAISLHGLAKGGYLTLKRILKCRPRGGMGYDPVPET